MEKRISRLQKNIKGDGKAFLITSGVNRFYLTDFSSSEGAVLITKKNAYLLVDFRYGEAAEKTAKSCKTVVFKKLLESVKQICSEEKIKQLLRI